MVFMSSIAGKIPAASVSVYNATKFGIRGFALAIREELWGTGVGVSVVCPTFVSEAGMWAETGLKADPIAGEVSPAQVAEAVWKAIVKNRADIDVIPIQLRASLKIMALALGCSPLLPAPPAGPGPTIMSRAEKVSVPSPASSR